MDTDGTHGGERRTPSGTGHVPRPAGPPGIQGLPPKPGHAPGAVPAPAAARAAGPTLAAWLRVPRPSAGPGVWSYGHVPRAEQEPTAPERSLIRGAIISLIACVIVWLVLRANLIPYWQVPPRLFTPSDWWPSLGRDPGLGTPGDNALQVYRLLVICGLLYGFGRLGNWRAAWNLAAARGRLTQGALAAVTGLAVLLIVPREVVPLKQLVYSLFPFKGAGAAHAAALVSQADTVLTVLQVLVGVLFLWLGVRRHARADGASSPGEPSPAAQQIAPGGPDDPGVWTEVRDAGMAEVADRLGAEVVAGRMNDVDFVRIRRAWETVRADPSRARAFAESVRDKGAGACVHPSGARELPLRAARHDLLARQVLLGTVQDGERNPYARRGSGFALDPGVLGTSLLAIGPSGAGKTSRLVRPVVESLALQALAGQAAVVVVASTGAALGPDEGYDVVVRVGDPDSVYDLDLYGGTTDADEAATLLAEGFVGDLPGVDVRRAATALAQLLGPFRAAYGRFPAVPELRELLDHVPVALAGLREALEAAGQHRMLRELDARERQHGAPADPGPALADRVALLDRPAFAGFFDTTGAGRPFSLRALEHPLRVRVDLPERGHADASRMLARLLLAQFNASAAARTDRTLFALLAFDDASHTLTPEAVRGIQRLRSANAGVLLTLRTLDDVPEALRTPLLGAVGCRMAFSGVTTWDGKRFAETWGTEWVETRDVTHRTVFADQPLTRAIHAFRKLVSGKAVTTDAVTVRQVERERWSASDLAHVVPPGHAVLSLTSVRGERAAPLLVRLGGQD
ncbi:ATP/GTP-binding protein [Streptomyces sp. NPDC002886]|uniref:ATP/GTP-binding protein n=1 Tax=Streptomyces sp. NPDC002886 TaxID=3364667 RepID=UPI0036B8349A